MMKVKALKTFSHGSAVVKRGSSFEVSDAISRDYVRAGLVEEHKKDEKKAPDLPPVPKAK